MAPLYLIWSFKAGCFILFMVLILSVIVLFVNAVSSACIFYDLDTVKVEEKTWKKLVKINLDDGNEDKLWFTIEAIEGHFNEVWI